MDRETWVYIDLDGTPRLVGRLWSRVRKRRESATFEYVDSWLARPDRFSLDPVLSLDPGAHHTGGGKALFGGIGDSAPDRWGRMLMRRAERRTAKEENRVPRTLNEIDYLLSVNDEARQGALRFAETEGGPFLAHGRHAPIPPLVELPLLLNASQRVIDEDETGELLQLLLAPGSSLGGARPKASVRDLQGKLAIAKFPHKDDETNAVLWEAVALSLASEAGIVVPAWRLTTVNDKHVLILQRFDRDGGNRIPFLSAMSMLGADDHETHSYLEIADAIRQHGATPTTDMKALWRRIVFSVLISNTDDHLRNHAFLYAGTDGWTLSPAYDLNPVPVDIKPRVLSVSIDDHDNSASFELALEVAEYFELTQDEARTIAQDVAQVVSGWQQVAAKLGLSRSEITRMASAFEHDDLGAALADRGRDQIQR